MVINCFSDSSGSLGVSVGILYTLRCISLALFVEEHLRNRNRKHLSFTYPAQC